MKGDGKIRGAAKGNGLNVPPSSTFEQRVAEREAADEALARSLRVSLKHDQLRKSAGMVAR